MQQGRSLSSPSRISLPGKGCRVGIVDEVLIGDLNFQALFVIPADYLRAVFGRLNNSPGPSVYE